MSTLKENYTLYGRKIRASNVVFPFGVGAMMDMPEGVFMTTSCDSWTTKSLTIIHDERLEKVLKVKYFKTPVVKSTEENRNIFMPLVQFPEWMFCPKCRKFQPLGEWEKQFKNIFGKDQVMKKNICPKCRVKLSPARVVTACENGHIDDFPWIQWVHYKNNKKVCSKPDIYIKTNGVSSGLEGIKIECKTCNIKMNMAGTFDSKKNVFEELEKHAINRGVFEEKYSLKCNGNRPWEGRNENCDRYPTVFQRGATNIYFPKVESSILIPPYSEKVNIMIEESIAYNSLLSSITFLKEANNPRSVIDNVIASCYLSISKEINIPLDIVKRIVDRKLNIDDDINENELESRIKYKEEEYRALIGEFGYNIIDQKDFKIEDVEGKKYNLNNKINYIDKVVLIHKLKEVRALVGFSRINAPDANIMEVEGENATSELIRPLKDKNWYPAVEIRGEGIFIKLDGNVINKWISSNEEINNRANDLDKKYNKILTERLHTGRKINSKFLLLHTLAHVIIKELSFKCGYSSTSLRERIYCNSLDTDYNMSGILIYTANGDSEGTLGGLVRQGREDKLPEIINSAVEKARFCSSDPVCVESKGQGRDALNLSACYSCVLVAETSCEEFNTLLDRAMLVGTLDNTSIGFFNYVDAN